MTISPVIKRLYPSLDPEQLAVIGHVGGPLLALAGPGSGKTMCVCLRAVNLLLTGRAEPHQLLLCTFTRATAREMQERICALSQQAGYRGDITRMRIATIHGLSLQLLSAHGGGVGLPPPTRVLSAWEQLDLLRSNFNRIFGPDLPTLAQHGWRTERRVLQQARRFFDRIADELIDPRELVNSHAPFTAALGHCYARYQEVLLEQGAIDFAGLQTQAIALLHDAALTSRLGASMRHILVDEYQDTNHAQQRLLFRLAEFHRSICVVGDEDQLIYRFRGANPQGLAAFRQRFPDAQVLELTANYRSHRDIVAAGNRWIYSFDWTNHAGAPFRHPKAVVPRVRHANADHPAVVSALGKDKADAANQLATLLLLLRGQGFITDMGQVAILLPSVKWRHRSHYVDALTHFGIPVHLTHDEHLVDGTALSDAAPLHPPGRVLVTTIHQAKGREWPVVCVGNLHSADLRPDELETQLGPHLTRWSAESTGRAAMFDLARQYYVAFSRAQRLLVLSAGATPHPVFRSVLDGVPHWADVDLTRLSGMQVQPPLYPQAPDGANGSVQLVVPQAGTLAIRPATVSTLHLEYRTTAE